MSMGAGMGKSDRVRLLLSKPEGLDVDYKVNARVDAEDLVAFANSPEGGTLLLGVEEITVDGVQQGRVVGCKVDDEARLTIVNKAGSCIPPVPVSVDVEWEDDKSFFVVNIPSGAEKPYCTSSGTYKIRGDGRNMPLVPSNLLNMLLEQEGERFLGRFRDATADLDTDISEMRAKLAEVTAQMAESLGNLQSVTEEKLDRISFLADNADANADEATSAAEQALREVRKLAKALDDLDDDVGQMRSILTAYSKEQEQKETLSWKLDRMDQRLHAIMRKLGLADGQSE